MGFLIHILCPFFYWVVVPLFIIRFSSYIADSNPFFLLYMLQICDSSPSRLQKKWVFGI